MVGIDLITTLVVTAKALYEASQEVKENHEECAAIRDTVAALAKTLQDVAPKGEYASNTMDMRLTEITKALRDITASMQYISRKSFVHRLLHRRGMRSKLKRARTVLQDSLAVFQLGAQAEGLVVMHELKYHVQRIMDAHRRDEETVEAVYIDIIKASEEDVIQNLGVQDNQMPEAMLALSKHITILTDGPEKKCCERGLDAMRRRTGDLRIPVDQFAISSYEVAIHREKKLGSGGFAKVYKGTYRDRAVAVKVLTEGTHWSALQQEVDVWKMLSHPHILQFVGACPIADPPFMVSELKENGDVLDYLRRNPDACRHKILYEASQGLEYLHERSIVHGDLKATNILIDENGSACLADFGLSRIKLRTTTIVNPGANPQRGTARWMSPEQLRGSSASRSSDVYSFAMTIHETFTGRPPFPDTPDGVLFTLVCEKDVRPQWEDVRPSVRSLGYTSAMWDVVTNCWKPNPKDRWTTTVLSNKLRDLLELKASAKVERPSLGLIAPPLVHSASSGPSFEPSKPGDFLHPYSPRPQLHPRHESAPIVGMTKISEDTQPLSSVSEDLFSPSGSSFSSSTSTSSSSGTVTSDVGSPDLLQFEDAQEKTLDHLFPTIHPTRRSFIRPLSPASLELLEERSASLPTSVSSAQTSIGVSIMHAIHELHASKSLPLPTIHLEDRADSVPSRTSSPAPMLFLVDTPSATTEDAPSEDPQRNGLDDSALEIEAVYGSSISLQVFSERKVRTADEALPLPHDDVVLRWSDAHDSPGRDHDLIDWDSQASPQHGTPSTQFHSPLSPSTSVVSTDTDVWYPTTTPCDSPSPFRLVVDPPPSHRVPPLFRPRSNHAQPSLNSSSPPSSPELESPELGPEDLPELPDIRPHASNRGDPWSGRKTSHDVVEMRRATPDARRDRDGSVAAAVTSTLKQASLR